MQPRAHGADRAAERRRRVGVAQFFEIAQQHDFAVADWQGHHRTAHRVDARGTLEFVGRVERARPTVVALGRLVIERPQPAVPRKTPPRVVAGDAEQPRDDGAAPTVVGSRPRA